jgi:ABC-type glycerol-3-phosphate transport system substrate-binding protein
VLPSSIFDETYSQGTSIFRVPEGTVGVPFGVDPMVMFYNRDILESSGFINPPRFWNGDFLEMVEALSVRNTDNLGIIRSGVPMGASNNINHFMPTLSTLIMQLGNPIHRFDPQTGLTQFILNGSSSFASNPAETALSYFMQFSNPSSSVYSWNSSMPESQDVFARGDSAFYLGFASELNQIQRKNPNLNFSVSQIPQTQELSRSVTYGNFYAFAVPRTATNSGVSLSVAGLLAGGPYSGQLLSSLSLQPVRKQTLAFNSPSFIQKVFFDAAIVSRAWIVPHPISTQANFATVISDIVSGVVQPSRAVGILNQILNES